MTFSRITKTPVNFLAYKNTGESLVGEGLHIQVSISHVDLPVEDALALADYINAHWRKETSD